MKSPSQINHLHRWVIAARPPTLTAAATPVLIGSALAAVAVDINWLLFVFAFTGAVLIQIGTNLADEYTDHRRSGGVAKFPAPHKVIQIGLLSERAVIAGTVLSFAISGSIGLYIVSQVGWPILLVGIFSMLAGYLHSSGPFPLGDRALGELTVFIFMGPLIVMASYYVQVQQVSWPVFWSSLPIAMLVTSILQCNNLRDEDEDRKEGKHTLVTILGTPAGHWIYVALLLGAYISLVSTVGASMTPTLALISLASLPWVLPLIRQIWQAKARPDFNRVLLGTVKLHLGAGLLMALGISIHAVLNT